MTHLSVLYREHLSLVDWIENRITRFCAARCIGILKRWTDFVVARRQDPWIYMPIQRATEGASWHGEMLGEYGKDAIKSALELLIGAGIIERRTNPFNGQDKTYQYKLNFSALTAAAQTCTIEAVPGEVLQQPISESEISQLEIDYSTSPQRSFTQTDFQEKRDDFSQPEDRGVNRETVPQSPEKSSENSGKKSGQNFGQKLDSKPSQGSKAQPVGEGQFSAAAAGIDFSELLKVNFARFEAPDPDDDSLIGEFFRYVEGLTRNLPRPPANPASAAEGWIRSKSKGLVRGFMKFKADLQRREAEKPAPFPKVEECQRTPQQMMEQYRRMWENPVLRPMVRTAIERFPQWFEMAEDGPRLKGGV